MVTHMERRRLLNLRALIDQAPDTERHTLAWMARMLGPDRLKKIDEAVGHMMKGEEAKLMVQKIRFEDALAKFPQKTREVLALRAMGMTLREVGEQYGQTGNNIRMIEQKAFRILRSKLPNCEPITMETFLANKWIFAKIGYETFPVVAPIAPVRRNKGIPDLIDLDMDIHDLGLSVRAMNCLENCNIRNLRDLIHKSERELLRTRNFGRKSLAEVKKSLAVHGLHLGMELK